MVTGRMNVAIRNYMDDECVYYIAQLDAEPWYVVPPGENLVSFGLWDAAGKNLEFPPGARVLHGYLWSRMDTRKRHYELLDLEFATANSARANTSSAWQGFPHVYFPQSMLLHVDFHLQPVISRPRGAGRRSTWGQLSTEDADIITGVVTDD